ncbi:putative zinc-binding protein [bacterium]|nr:putative zinc-binding protein [bacterium]
MSSQNTDVCDTGKGDITLIFACSGAADVGHVSDLAARKLMDEGYGNMFCLAGLGGKVEPIIKKTASADRILVIDGCPLDCAKETVEQAGFDNFHHYQVTALGLDKGATPPTESAIETVAAHGRSILSA